MTIGERIRKIRKDAQLTLEKFGARIKISAQSVSRIETGINNPSDQTVALICQEFNISETWLRTGDGPMEAAQPPPPPGDEVDQLLDRYGLPRELHVLMDEYLKLSENAKAEIREMFTACAERLVKEPETSEQEKGDNRRIDKIRQLHLTRHRAQILWDFLKELNAWYDAGCP